MTNEQWEQLKEGKRRADEKRLLADLLDLARNIAGLDERYIGTTTATRAIHEWRAQARAALAKTTTQGV